MPNSADGGAPGDVPVKNTVNSDIDFSTFVPEEQREAYNAHVQSLIDRGVNIGVARARKSIEKEKDSKAPAPFEDVSAEDKDFLQNVLTNKKSLTKLLEVYGTTDLSEIEHLIEEAENAELSDKEKLEKNNEKLVTKIADLEAQLANSSSAEDSTKIQKRLDSMEIKLQNNLVTKALRMAAENSNAIDPDDIVQALTKKITIFEVEDEDTGEIDFIPAVVDDDGEPRLKSDNEVFSIEELVSEYLTKKPHLKKPSVKTGAGSSSAPAPKGGAEPKTINGIDVDDLRDPKKFGAHSLEIQRMIRSGAFRSQKK